MKFVKFSLTSLALVFSFSSVAQAQNNYLPYVGVDYAYSDVDMEHKGSDNNSLSFTLGSEYNRYFSTEVFVQQTDKDSTHYNHFNRVKRSTSFRAYGLDLLGYQPLGCEQRFSLIGTAGIGEYNFHNKYNIAGLSRKHHDHGIGYRLGGGLQYIFDNHWSARAMLRYVNFNKITDADNMWEYTTGLRYTF